MKFLLDTNAVSELQKAGTIHPRFRSWYDAQQRLELATSALVFGELRRGVEMLRPRDAVRARSLEAWMDALLESFDDRILPVTREAAEIYGRAAARGTPPMIDGLIASQAVAADLILVTRNTKDMARFGARLLDPFAGNA
jgi:toxin FitB